MRWSLAILGVTVAAAQPFPRYDVRRADSPVVVDGRLDEPAWRRAKPTTKFHFNWWTSGDKEPTVARLLWDDTNLYAGYYCHDRHISATVTERHGPVSLDDCVEIFLRDHAKIISQS
jgi:Carbohydrate family 9 binding domain-like